MKPGWTVHEMIISLTVTGLIVALAASAAVGQLRFFRGVGEVSALRTQVSQAVTIAANVLRGASSRSDLHVASDSAIELSVTIATAVTCRPDTGRLVVARASAAGNTLASYTETPQPGDVAQVLIAEAPASWLQGHVASEAGSSACARFPDIGAWEFTIAEPFTIPAGTLVRFMRRTRISLYRASDARWYLGLKEWNPALQRFNAVQPVAGPLRPYGGREVTGLLFDYHDAAGGRLTPPVDPAQVGFVTIVARGETVRPARVAGLSPASGAFPDSARLSVAWPGR